MAAVFVIRGVFEQGLLVLSTYITGEGGGGNLPLTGVNTFSCSLPSAPENNPRD